MSGNSITASKFAGCAGIDGCAGGWIAIACINGEFKADLFSNFQDVVKCHVGSLLLVDMPMGLTEGTRTLERAARSMLTGRSSSIFPVPCRAAVYADSYEQASLINAHNTGTRISKQSWNICKKIREVDGCLKETPAISARVYESHPELAFHLLSEVSLKHSKKTAAGQQERLELLQTYLPESEVVYTETLQRYPRKAVGRDDILDALVLLVTGLGDTVTLFGEESHDDLGLPIRMLLPR